MIFNGLFAYLFVRTEARGVINELEMLGSEILSEGIEYMKGNWRVWCQRISLPESLIGEYPDAVLGEDNKDNDCK